MTMIWSGYEADQRLAGMDLSVEDFRHAAEAAHATYVSRSPNDAPFFPGTAAWNTALRTLRNLTCVGTRPFRKADPSNLSLTINDKREFSIVVASGDRSTGKADRKPSNKSPKGLRGALAVEANSTAGDLFPETLSADENAPPTTDGYQTWFFLVYVTDEAVQSELSLPREIDSEGFIVSWFERILLPTLEIDPGKIATDPDTFTPELDFDIRRKG